MNHYFKYWLRTVLFLGLPVWLALSILLFSHPAHSSERNHSEEKQWQFRVFLDDSEIGYHHVTMQPVQDIKRVKVNADFKVKFLFFTAFRYQHQANEVWQGSCLTDLQSTTNNNGEKLFVATTASAEGFRVQSAFGEQLIEGCVRSFAYWDLELLKADHLLNTQSGEVEAVELQALGDNVLEFEGQRFQASKYRLVLKDKNIDLWYSPDSQWLALQSETEGGYQLSYYPDRVAF